MFFLFLFVTDSEKFHDMDRATEAPPLNALRIDDDGEFPPMTQKLDWIFLSYFTSILQNFLPRNSKSFTRRTPLSQIIFFFQSSLP